MMKYETPNAMDKRSHNLYHVVGWNVGANGVVEEV